MRLSALEMGTAKPDLVETIVREWLFANAYLPVPRQLDEREHGGRQRMISGPRREGDYPDREVDCQEAMEPGFQAIVDCMLEAVGRAAG